MLWVYLEIFLLQSSESDVYRRQILTTKVDPRAVRVNDKLMTIAITSCMITKLYILGSHLEYHTALDEIIKSHSTTSLSVKFSDNYIIKALG